MRSFIPLRGGVTRGGGGRGYVVFSVDCLSLTVRYRRFLNREKREVVVLAVVYGVFLVLCGGTSSAVR